MGMYQGIKKAFSLIAGTTKHQPKERRMKELITINSTSINNEVRQTVNARELHSFLGIGKDFSSWVKAQIDRARLSENRDFVTFTQKGERKEGVRGATVSIEYHLTLDAAKHVAMMSGTDKGFEVRDYFIECERRAKQDPMLTLNDPAAMRSLLLSYCDKMIAQEQVIAEIQPKAIALDRISTARGSLCLTDAAKHLQMNPKALTSWLDSNHWIYRRPVGRTWIAYQDKLRSGVLEHKLYTQQLESGEEMLHAQVRVTPKGLTLLAEIFSASMLEAA